MNHLRNDSDELNSIFTNDVKLRKIFRIYTKVSYMKTFFLSLKKEKQKNLFLEF